MNKHVYNSLWLDYYELGDFIRFNNNNIWEIVDNEGSGYMITCYKRDFGNRADSISYKQVIDENEMSTDIRNFNYTDWKSFYGAERLKKIVVDFSTEQTVLPLIYYVKYVLGFNDDSKMERIRSSKWIFRK